MGQFCSFCRYLCFCFKFNNRRRIKDRPFKLWEQQPWLTPSSIPDNELAADYFDVPSERFKCFEDVFRYKGYECNRSDNFIGKGKSGVVYKMTRIKDKKDLALKQIKFEGTKRNKKEFLNLKNEIYIISKIRHKNITHLLDDFIINYSICFLVMEFANSGTVQQEVDKSPISEQKAKTYFKQMVGAVQYLHHYDPPIAHRDIKLANILIHIENNEKIIKLTDFGFSRILNLKTDGKIFRTIDPLGTPGYMSPQLLKLVLYRTAEDSKEREKMKKRVKKDLDTSIKTVNPIKADIWALGICLFVMISGKLPFNLDENKIFKTVKEQYELEREPIQNNVNKSISLELNDLFDKMLEPNTKRRINIHGISQHQWLSGVSDVIILKKRQKVKTTTKAKTQRQ